MKCRLSEAVVTKIHQTLNERFGEPIGDVKDIGPGVANERGGKPHKGEDPGNSGWGSAQVTESAMTCNQCGGMMGMDEAVCSGCGMMGESLSRPKQLTEKMCRTCHGMGSIEVWDDEQNMQVEQTCPACGGEGFDDYDDLDESENGGRHYGHAASCTCADCSRSYEETHKDPDDPMPVQEDDALDQQAPPGREKQVKALKKVKGVKNPFAVAWSQYDKQR
jgi:hypothetical protein